MPRRQLADAQVDGARRGNIEAGEVFGQRLGIDSKVYPRVFLERADFGSERDPAAGERRVEERLDPEPVAGEGQLLSLLVPEREREHADGAGKPGLSLALQEGEKDLGVAGAPEPFARSLELGAQGAEIIDLAVEGDDKAAAVRNHRLRRGRREVDDRKPGVGEAEASVALAPFARTVGAAVAQQALRAGEEAFGNRGRAGQTAHG